MPRPSDSEPGPLLAHGRAADVYALDERRVLRRYRGPYDTEDEARLIEHVRAHGFPTAAVLDAGPRDLVLERVHGPTMADDIVRRPWKFGAHARALAALHDRLHAITAPAWLDRAPAGEGARVVHLDLHPLNVLLGSDGPVVIDWTNAGRGRAEVDIALTWVLLKTGVPDGNRALQVVAAVGKQQYARLFAHAADPGGTARRDGLEAAAGFRLRDPNLHDAERRALERLLAQPR